MFITEEANVVAVSDDAVATAVREGLSAGQKWLPAWLFYDAEGSELFEQITALPEYYLTRTERSIFAGYADGIVQKARDLGEGPLRMVELGAGTAAKTGILLDAAVRMQGATEYRPIDVSATALDEACRALARTLPGVQVQPQVANYVTGELVLPRHDGPTLALYIGSSIGNFAPREALAVLQKLRAQLRTGDSLLLGVDMVKDRAPLEAAYADAAGVTAAFNKTVLRRLNHELAADFDLDSFQHLAFFNEAESRIEMHLRSTREQRVRLGLLDMELKFAAGETIHTENSYKFTDASLDRLLADAGFESVKVWTDERRWFRVTLAAVV